MTFVYTRAIESLITTVYYEISAFFKQNPLVTHKRLESPGIYKSLQPWAKGGGKGVVMWSGVFCLMTYDPAQSTENGEPLHRGNNLSHSNIPTLLLQSQVLSFL